MADLFQITPPVIRAEGKDVPPEQIQAGFNSLARQTQLALNTVGSDPTGPAGGDLSGNYPNPTVTGSHIASGTVSGVVITGSTLDSTPVGQSAASSGAFTTLTATTPVGVASGGTGQNTLSAHNVLLGEGTGGVGFAAPSTAGKMLVSAGAAVDPAFANNPAVIGGTVDSTPVGATTPSTGAFTTLTATTPVGVASGGTGRATLLAHGVLVGEGTAGINQLAVGNTGQMLLGSSGADPGFGNNPTITGGTIDGVVIGGTTPAAGHFTTVSATGAITPSSTNGIVGTTTNDNANAGSVGEYATASTQTTSVTSGVTMNATSVSLTAGDWDVEGLVQTNPAGTTVVTGRIAGVNTLSATVGTAATGISNATETFYSAPAGFTEIVTAPRTRISIASTTTVFLVTNISFTVSTCTVSGFIRARRVR